MPNNLDSNVSQIVLKKIPSFFYVRFSSGENRRPSVAGR